MSLAKTFHYTISVRMWSQKLPSKKPPPLPSLPPPYRLRTSPTIRATIANIFMCSPRALLCFEQSTQCCSPSHLPLHFNPLCRTCRFQQHRSRYRPDRSFRLPPFPCHAFLPLPSHRDSLFIANPRDGPPRLLATLRMGSADSQSPYPYLCFAGPPPPPLPFPSCRPTPFPLAPNMCMRILRPGALEKPTLPTLLETDALHHHSMLLRPGGPPPPRCPHVLSLPLVPPSTVPPCTEHLPLPPPRSHTAGRARPMRGCRLQQPQILPTFARGIDGALNGPEYASSSLSIVKAMYSTSFSHCMVSTFNWPTRS